MCRYTKVQELQVYSVFDGEPRQGLEQWRRQAWAGGGGSPEIAQNCFLMDGKYTILLLANGDVYLMMLLLIFNHQNHKYGNASEF